MRAPTGQAITHCPQNTQVLSFNGINSLRQHIREKARVHGIIAHGGDAANIVPDHTAGTFVVRAEENDYLEELKRKVLDCFVGAATATGARLEYRWAEVCYQAMRSNMTMAQLFQTNMESLGRSMCFTNSSGTFSTDMGNVSNVVPGIHPLISIAPPDVLVHSPRFTEAAISMAGIEGMLDGAKAMAMTAIDLLAEPELLKKIRAEFEGR